MCCDSVVQRSDNSSVCTREDFSAVPALLSLLWGKMVYKLYFDPALRGSNSSIQGCFCALPMQK